MQDETESNREEGDPVDVPHVTDCCDTGSDKEYNRTLIKYILFLGLFIGVIVAVSKMVG